MGPVALAARGGCAEPALLGLAREPPLVIAVKIRAVAGEGWRIRGCYTTFGLWFLLFNFQ